MAKEIDYQDPICLALLIKGILKSNKGKKYDAYFTSNPASEEERNVVLTQRIYRKGKRDSGSLGTFVGYISYRACEAKYCRTNQKLPAFSSIEFLAPGYKHVSKKFHFMPKKIEKKDPSAFKAIKDSWDGEGDFDQYVGKTALVEFVKAIIHIMDSIK